MIKRATNARTKKTSVTSIIQEVEDLIENPDVKDDDLSIESNEEKIELTITDSENQEVTNEIVIEDALQEEPIQDKKNKKVKMSDKEKAKKAKEKAKKVKDKAKAKDKAKKKKEKEKKKAKAKKEKDKAKKKKAKAKAKKIAAKKSKAKKKKSSKKKK
jgi:hypothetical protein